MTMCSMISYPTALPELSDPGVSTIHPAAPVSGSPSILPNTAAPSLVTSALNSLGFSSGSRHPKW
jgi:hypothetical protein